MVCKLSYWRVDGETGIPRVGVKFVEMWKNIGGEGESLVYY